MHNDMIAIIINAPESEQTIEQTTTNATGLVPDQETVVTAAGETSGNLVEAPAPEAPPAETVPDQAPAVNRSLIGARAHFRGQLLAAFVGRLMDAVRVLLFANHHTLDGVPFQIRTSSQRSFTVNPGTEPPQIIVAAKVRDRSLSGATRYALYGVLRDEAIAHGQRSTSRGHAKSAHLIVALGKIEKVDLGTIVISDELLTADDSEARRRLLQTIDSLQPDLDLDAVNATRAFLSAAEDKPIVSATNPAEGENAAPAKATAAGEVPAE